MADQDNEKQPETKTPAEPERVPGGDPSGEPPAEAPADASSK